MATHNHFVLDRGGKVFKQSAPVIKLPKEATEDDHLALLGVLNSSTACFWLKQNSHNKGSTGGGSGAAASEPWEDVYEFTGTTLQGLPAPSRVCHSSGLASSTATASDGEASASTRWRARGRDTPTCERLSTARTRASSSMRGRMVAVQEELDWEVYRSTG